MIDCQLITYINYCLTHYLMSNLIIAKAKADVEAQAAAKKEEKAREEKAREEFAEAQAKKEEEVAKEAEAGR